MAHGCDHKTEDTLLGGADTETTLKRNRLTIDSARIPTVIPQCQPGEWVQLSSSGDGSECRCFSLQQVR